MIKILHLYDVLLKEYGKQNGRPLSKTRMQTKHHSRPPKDDYDRWEIIIGAILTQNTLFRQ